MDGLYIHIPFCRSKCIYCDFYSVTECGTIDRYPDALKNELDFRRRQFPLFEPDTIFIGGGTPTILTAEELSSLCGMLKEYVPHIKEFTVEANPGTLDGRKLDALLRGGCNRLSLGLQSTDNMLLKMLGRIHTFADFIKTYELARHAGFDNINIDLMLGLPGQTAQLFADSLETVCALSPEHISAYSLTIDENTPIAHLLSSGKLVLPDEDCEREMYHSINSICAGYGYSQYEISNWSKKGRECKHNIKYWSGENYIGLGPAAHSLYEGKRFYNPSELSAYMNACLTHCDPSAEYTSLTIRDRIAEYMITALRMNRGITRSVFMLKFGSDIDEIYGDKLVMLKKKGLISDDGVNIRLTETGFDLADLAFVEFV